MQVFLALLGLTVANAALLYKDTSVTVSTVNVDESEPAASLVATLRHAGGATPNLFNSVTGPTILWSTQDGSATAGKDYQAVVNNKFKFDTDADGAYKALSVQLINDNIQEYTETFTVQLQHDPLNTDAQKAMKLSAGVISINDNEGNTNCCLAFICFSSPPSSLSLLCFFPVYHHNRFKVWLQLFCLIPKSRVRMQHSRSLLRCLTWPTLTSCWTTPHLMPLATKEQ